MEGGKYDTYRRKRKKVSSGDKGTRWGVTGGRPGEVGWSWISGHPKGGT